MAKTDGVLRPINTIDAVCGYLGVSRSFLAKEIRLRKLSVLRLGRRCVRVKDDAVLDYIAIREKNSTRGLTQRDAK